MYQRTFAERGYLEFYIFSHPARNVGVQVSLNDNTGLVIPNLTLHNTEFIFPFGTTVLRHSTSIVSGVPTGRAGNEAEFSNVLYESLIQSQVGLIRLASVDDSRPSATEVS